MLYFNRTNLTFKLNQLVTPLVTILEFTWCMKRERQKTGNQTRRGHTVVMTHNTLGTCWGPD